MKVVVLAGGISTERDVSLISGKMIYQAMKRLGHQAVLLDVFLGMERDDIDHIFESDEAGYRLKKGQEPGEDQQPKFPCVVKVSSGGSSIGVSIVQKEEDYQAALDDAFLYGDEVVVEEYIKGRELTCCVLDGKALPIVEIAPKEGFYDYKNKYQAGSTIEICPAPIGEESTRKIQKISERVFDALRLHKYARMDFMMDEAGNAYCLEANTLPGMTPTSLIPQEAAAVGISYDELCQKILDMAFED